VERSLADRDEGAEGTPNLMNVAASIHLSWSQNVRLL